MFDVHLLVTCGASASPASALIEPAGRTCRSWITTGMATPIKRAALRAATACSSLVKAKRAGVSSAAASGSERVPAAAVAPARLSRAARAAVVGTWEGMASAIWAR